MVDVNFLKYHLASQNQGCGSIVIVKVKGKVLRITAYKFFNLTSKISAPRSYI
jgi:hypothetical protein